MEIRKIKLEDLDSVFELLNELYENKIEYSKFTQKYKESLEDSSFYGIVAIEAQASGLPTFIADNLSEQIFATENSYGISLKNSDIDIAKFILKKSQKLKRKSPVMKKYDIRNMVNRILECYET